MTTALGEDTVARLREVLACATAPFHEERVQAVIREAARRSFRLRVRADRFGNLELRYGPGRPRLYFACHLDHPALEFLGDSTAAIRGGLRPERLVGTRLRTFDGSGPRPVVARVVSKAPGAKVRLKGARDIPRRTPLLLDLPAFRITSRRIHARAADDLCAVAACLTLFDRLKRARWQGAVGALFTRAEEVGFAGALGWTRTTRTPRTTTIINLEMSRALPHTPLGKGPVLRVGDRVTCFSSEVAIELESVAGRLAARDSSFAYQRALMDGGACEATVYAAAGFRTGALCLPLRNYHNHAARGGMGLEFVDAGDAENLVRLMVAFVRRRERSSGGKRLAARLEKLWRRNRRRLEASARRGGGNR